MQKHFSHRDELIRYLQIHFQSAYERGSEVSPIQGGVRAAELALKKIHPSLYTQSRNYLSGSVTRLSPYIRHGVISLAQVRKHILESADRHSDGNEKLISELGWRDYWQHLYWKLGNQIWNDQESIKTGLEPDDYAPELPQDIVEGKTGLACIDAFILELRQTGYIHNHARMWLAAYIVHWRRIQWQAGAKWFLEHLLDGDPASNNLSWQWVASTFSDKPYFFNRENLEKYSNNIYCDGCPLRGKCPFEGSYEEHEARLFATRKPASKDTAKPYFIDQPSKAPSTSQNPVIWIQGDCLGHTTSALRLHPHAPAIWVWDDELLEQWKTSFKRIVFLYECLLDLPVTIRRGNPIDEIKRFAQENQTTGIVTTNTPAPRFSEIVNQITKTHSVDVFPAVPFTDYSGEVDLKRFSRYWKVVKPLAIAPLSI